jgi:hypothetical protein
VAIGSSVKLVGCPVAAAGSSQAQMSVTYDASAGVGLKASITGALRSWVVVTMASRSY